MKKVSMKRVSMMKCLISSLLIFALVFTSIAVPVDVFAATKYAKSASKTLQDYSESGESYFVIPINMKKDAKVTVTVQFVSDGGEECPHDPEGAGAYAQAFEYVSDFNDGESKGAIKPSKYVRKQTKKSSVSIQARKGKTAGVLVGIVSGAKVKVTVKCDKAYVSLGKVQDHTSD